MRLQWFKYEINFIFPLSLSFSSELSLSLASPVHYFHFHPLMSPRGERQWAHPVFRNHRKHRTSSLLCRDTSRTGHAPAAEPRSLRPSLQVMATAFLPLQNLKHRQLGRGIGTSQNSWAACPRSLRQVTTAGPAGSISALLGHTQPRGTAQTHSRVTRTTDGLRACSEGPHRKSADRQCGVSEDPSGWKTYIRDWIGCKPRWRQLSRLFSEYFNFWRSVLSFWCKLKYYVSNSRLTWKG